MKYFDPDADTALKDAFEQLVLDWPGVTPKTMFGCPSYLANGTLFAVLVSEGVALTRLPNGHSEELETSFDTRPFKAGARTVKKWIQVVLDDPSDLDSLRPYVRASYESARQGLDTK